MNREVVSSIEDDDGVLWGYAEDGTLVTKTHADWEVHYDDAGAVIGAEFGSYVAYHRELENTVAHIEAWMEDDRYDIEVHAAAINLDLSPTEMGDQYYGSFENDEAFAEEYATAMGVATADWPYSYIDWASAASELMHDFSEYNGHYFKD